MRQRCDRGVGAVWWRTWPWKTRYWLVNRQRLSRGEAAKASRRGTQQTNDSALYRGDAVVT